MAKSIPITKVVWDSKIYPRNKWNTETVKRYADAMESGDEFPPLTLENGTNRLLDGKHRLLAYQERKAKEVSIAYATVPKGMSVKYFAATLSAKHGDRMSNADLKALAVDDFTDNPSMKAIDWGKGLGISDRTVRNWVSHITNKERQSREVKSWRLSRLGWTQSEIAELLGVERSLIAKDVKNGNLADFHTSISDDWNATGLADAATRLNLPLTDAWAAALDGLDDAERFERLGIKSQPYDVWHFQSCHDLMGDAHPGRIPGELICHVLYFYTKQGDIVYDPMAGSGTTLDACLLMGRKCFGFDIDLRHERPGIIEHDIANDGWHDKVKKSDLIFWDPPYFDKKDNEYVEGSISGFDQEDYLGFFAEALSSARKACKKGCVLAFLMSSWNDNAGKLPGIMLWDYADIIAESGWTLEREIQAPLGTQQVHPDIVNKYRASRKLARLSRSLIIARAI